MVARNKQPTDSWKCQRTQENQKKIVLKPFRFL